jgi:hypothetical protein
MAHSVRHTGVIRSSHRREGSRYIIEWRADDQLEVKRESRLPPWWAFNPTVFVATGEWKDYAEKSYRALLSAASNQPVAAALGRRLAAEATGDENTLRAIRDYVSRNIRLAGPAFGDLPMSCITPADKTLGEGYGNSADRAVLLFAMLRGGGIKSRFVLASRGPREKKLQQVLLKYPAMSTFPDVLVCVKTRGRKIFLNDTDQYATLGMTGHDGCAGLWVNGGGIHTIRAEKQRTDDRQSYCRIVLDDAGNARIEMKHTYFGALYAANHRRFAEMPPEERNRYYQKILTALSQRARPAGKLLTSFAGYPGTEEFSAEVESFAVVDGDYCYFNLPLGLRNLLGLRADERHNAIYWSATRKVTLITDIVFPEQFRLPVLLPENSRWRAPSGGGSVAVTLKRNLKDEQGRYVDLRLIYKVDLSPAVIPADHYRELLRLNRRLSHAKSRTILLRRN